MLVFPSRMLSVVNALHFLVYQIKMVISFSWLTGLDGAYRCFQRLDVEVLVVGIVTWVRLYTREVIVTRRLV